MDRNYAEKVRDLIKLDSSHTGVLLVTRDEESLPVINEIIADAYEYEEKYNYYGIFHTNMIENEIRNRSDILIKNSCSSYDELIKTKDILISRDIYMIRYSTDLFDELISCARTCRAVGIHMIVVVEEDVIIPVDLLNNLHTRIIYNPAFNMSNLDIPGNIAEKLGKSKETVAIYTQDINKYKVFNLTSLEEIK